MQLRHDGVDAAHAVQRATGTSIVCIMPSDARPRRLSARAPLALVLRRWPPCRPAARREARVRARRRASAAAGGAAPAPGHGHARRGMLTRTAVTPGSARTRLLDAARAIRRSACPRPRTPPARARRRPASSAACSGSAAFMTAPSRARSRARSDQALTLPATARARCSHCPAASASASRQCAGRHRRAGRRGIARRRALQQHDPIETADPRRWTNDSVSAAAARRGLQPWPRTRRSAASAVSVRRGSRAARPALPRGRGRVLAFPVIVLGQCRIAARSASASDARPATTASSGSAMTSQSTGIAAQRTIYRGGSCFICAGASKRASWWRARAAIVDERTVMLDGLGARRLVGRAAHAQRHE